MNSNDPLAQLRDIHLPADISWWPPAPGWWVLALLCLLLVVYGCWRTWSRYRARAYRRAALLELASARENWLASNDDERYLADVNRIVKRVALISFPRQSVASLSGDAWLEFLDQHWRASPCAGFRENAQLQNLYAPAQSTPGEPLETQALYELIRSWINKHQESAC